MSSKRRLRKRQCTRKQRLTKSQAYAAAHDIQKRKRIYILPYKCRWCGEWHIGKPDKKIKFFMKRIGEL